MLCDVIYVFRCLSLFIILFYFFFFSYKYTIIIILYRYDFCDSEIKMKTNYIVLLRKRIKYWYFVLLTIGYPLLLGKDNSDD